MTRRPSEPAGEDAEPTGTGGFLGQLGLMETGSGMPHGPFAILLAVVAAIVIVPLTRLARMLLRR